MGTILAELVEAMAPEKLADVAASESELAQVQRLGWLLDHLNQSLLADALHAALPTSRATLPRTRLDPAGGFAGHAGNRWKIIENAQPQSDL